MTDRLSGPIAFVGAGNMARALIRGLLAGGQATAQQITASEIEVIQARLQAYAEQPPPPDPALRGRVSSVSGNVSYAGALCPGQGSPPPRMEPVNAGRYRHSQAGWVLKWTILFFTRSDARSPIPGPSSSMRRFSKYSGGGGGGGGGCILLDVNGYSDSLELSAVGGNGESLYPFT